MYCEFAHFDIYWRSEHHSFNKKSDPLTLFFHWCMIHHRFQYSCETCDFLIIQPKWNEKADAYALKYTKHNIDFKAEIDLRNKILQIQIIRLSDLKDVKSQIDVDEYITDDYKNSKYQLAFKKHLELYERIKFCVNCLRQIPDSLNRIRASKIVSNDNVNKSNHELTHSNLLALVKKEKIEYDLMMSRRRSSNCSNKSMGNSRSQIDNVNSKKETLRVSTPQTNHIEAKAIEHDDLNDKQPNPVIDTSSSSTLLNQNNTERNESEEVVKKMNADQIQSEIPESKLLNSLDSQSSSKTQNTIAATKTSTNSKYPYKMKITDFYVTNPITNYLNYNRDAGKLLFDQKLQNENEWVRNQFKKYNLVNCTVDIVDFKELDVFKCNYIKYFNLKNKKGLLPIKQDVKLTTSFLSKLDEISLKKSKDSKSKETIASTTCSTITDINNDKPTISSCKSSITVTSFKEKTKRLRRISQKPTNNSEPLINNLNASANTAATQITSHADDSSKMDEENVITPSEIESHNKNESNIEVRETLMSSIRKTPIKDSNQMSSVSTSPLKNISTITNIFDKMINSSQRNKKVSYEPEKNAKVSFESASNKIRISPIRSKTHDTSFIESNEQILNNTFTNKNENHKKRKRRDSDNGINQVNILNMLNKFRTNKFSTELDKKTLVITNRTLSTIESNAFLFKKFNSTKESECIKENAKSNKSFSTLIGDIDLFRDKSLHENPPKRLKLDLNGIASPLKKVIKTNVQSKTQLVDDVATKANGNNNENRNKSMNVSRNSSFEHENVDQDKAKKFDKINYVLSRESSESDLPNLDLSNSLGLIPNDITTNNENLNNKICIEHKFISKEISNNEQTESIAGAKDEEDIEFIGFFEGASDKSTKTNILKAEPITPLKKIGCKRSFLIASTSK